MANFEIYQGVALPAAKRGNLVGREAVYPFDQLGIGELMVVEGKTSKNFGGTVRAGEKRTGFAFTLRSGPIKGTNEAGEEVDIVPEGSVGVWRIAAKAPRKATVRTPEQIAASKAKSAATRAANKAKKG